MKITYARWADKTPHVVLSRTLDKVVWKATRIVRDVEEIRKLKHQPGKDIYAVGGATLVGSLMNAGLVDELHLMVNPLVLGGGKAL
jgi:dihydrofolate reductase